ncbi:hypothetical protein CPB85DRAFT_844763 [Mucidula mucida]|nr:hypothetical protein CPB85DRAFT_844763 [Mucidula mucida]
MQEETKQRHAEAHPGYEYHPAKPGEGKAAKKRKMKSSKSSARVSPPKTQTPVWDAALEPFQFTFQIESPLVNAPQQFTNAPLPPVNGQEHAQSRDHFAPQPFVDASSEQPSAFSGNEFYGRENFAVAGPRMSRTRPNHRTPSMHSTERLFSPTTIRFRLPRHGTLTSLCKTRSLQSAAISSSPKLNGVSILMR